MWSFWVEPNTWNLLSKHFNVNTQCNGSVQRLHSFGHPMTNWSVIHNSLTVDKVLKKRRFYWQFSCFPPMCTSEATPHLIVDNSVAMKPLMQEGGFEHKTQAWVCLWPKTVRNEKWLTESCTPGKQAVSLRHCFDGIKGELTNTTG